MVTNFTQVKHAKKNRSADYAQFCLMPTNVFLFQSFFTNNSNFLRTSFIYKSLRMEAPPHGYLQGQVRDSYNAIFLTIHLNRYPCVNFAHLMLKKNLC